MKQGFALIVVLAASSWLCASTPVIPETTLAQETANNTSAVNSFRSQSNGNLGASNISKAPIKSLLYPGFSGKLYVHFMPWFGGTSHMNVGYESNDATQVAKQVTDMMSRGVDGAIVDWYGPNSARANGTTKLLLAESEKRNGQFQFAITEDKGALKSCAATTGCDVTGQMISDLTYAYNTYENSSAYIHFSGRPVVFFFGVEAYALDWTRVIASVPGNPLFIQRNSGAFSNPNNNGAYAWPAPNSANPSDIGDAYLGGFYSTGLAHPAGLPFGTAYKGFNDRLALWTANRVTNQNCGQTFLSTFAKIAKYYSVNTQIFAVQLATWNDYEEGTELESGVDNCVSIQAASAATSVSWTISGSANTVDHYTVFVSTDGINLMTVANVPATQSSYDFKGYALAAGNYTVYVEAVGAPFMLNHMSGTVALSIAYPTPSARLTITPSSGTAPITVVADTSASTDPGGSIGKTTIDFGDGTILSGVTGSHVYARSGTYLVTAIVTDADGSTTSKATSPLTVMPTVTARLAITPSNGSAPVTVSANTSASTDIGGSIAKTTIDFGDGTILSGIAATHVYPLAGSYVVTATVTDTDGVTISKATATVSVSPVLVAKLNITQNNGTAPVMVTANTAASTDIGGSIAKTTIDFGDGTILSGVTASHIYTKAGTYVVIATVTGNDGATAIATSSLSVAPAPAAPPLVSGVSISSPAPNATILGSVIFAASAKALNPITAMRIYVDNTSRYLVGAATIHTTLTLAKGVHGITVQAWDSKGTVYKSSLSITVK